MVNIIAFIMFNIISYIIVNIIAYIMVNKIAYIMTNRTPNRKRVYISYDPGLQYCLHCS